MSRLVFVFTLVFWMFAGGAQAQPDRSADAVVSIGPQESGNWEVTYRFAEPQERLAFVRSGSDYRDATWTLTSDNARFGRVAGIDVIVFDEPAREVSFSIIPLTGELQGDYTPFVLFRDGGVAVHTGQFPLRPFGSLEALQDAAAEGEVPELKTKPLTTDVTVSSEGSLIAGGETHDGTLTQPISGDGTYIYMGEAELQAFDGFDAVLDTTLPTWLREQFAEQVLGRILGAYEVQWGRELDTRPTVMIAYKGGRAEGLSVTGGAAGDMLMMAAGGKQLDEPDPDTLAYLHWFLAHEIAQLYQAKGGLSLERNGDAWIHEGAANTMAYTQIAAMLDEDAGARFLAGIYGTAFEECVSALEEGALATAAERGAYSAHYACGDFVALATDGFLRRRDLYAFWNVLLDRALSVEEPELNAGLYFTTMQLLGATPGQQNLIKTVVGEEAPDNPRKALTRMLSAAGLSPEFDGEGQLVSLDWPNYSPEEDEDPAVPDLRR